MSKIYIHKGERLTTPSGQIIAIANRDVLEGDLANVDAFNWQIEKPNPPCPMDQGCFRKVGFGGVQAHVEGEWR